MTDYSPALGAPTTPVVVTGGASGIGLASACALAAVGRPVALWDINEQGAADAAARISQDFGVAAIGLAADLRDSQAVAPLAVATRRALGPVGGLVHSAGTAITTGIGGVTPDIFDAGMALHVRSLVQMVQAFGDDLKSQPGSAVVAISSINAWFGNGMIPVYSAAKGAVLSLVRSMADELAHDGVRINSVSPGMVDTPILGDHRGQIKDTFSQRIFAGRFGRPEEVGRVVRFLLSNEASYMTGSQVVVDGGIRHSQRP